MARTKTNGTVLKTLEDADRVLRELGEVETSLEEIDNTANAEIAKLKEKAAIEGKALRDKHKEHVAAIEAFAVYFRQDYFKDRKSLERPFGTFGFRKAPDAISVSKETAELLLKAGLEGFVRTKIEPDKEAMLSLDEDTLAAVRASRRTKEDFFVEPRREQPNQDMVKKSA